MPRAPRRSGSSALPAFVEPQLAKLVSTAPEGDAWVHELKFDGYRILARLDDGEVTLHSRRGHDWTAQFAPVADAVSRLAARTALVDGEVAVLRPDGTTSFQALQGHRTGPLTYFVFDLLHVDGEDTTPLPLVERKARLRALVDSSEASGAASVIRYADHVEGAGGAFFRAACGRGLEGIISKQRAAPYQPGGRGAWVKTKCIQRQELVIAGFTDPEGSRAGLGALLVGHYQDGALVFAGKVGTGFGARTLRELRTALDAREQKACPFAVTPSTALTGRGVHWVKPELVAEVAFTEWTADGRLRHPSFQGLRADKAARDVVREAPTPVVDRAPAGSAEVRRAKKASAASRPRKR